MNSLLVIAEYEIRRLIISPFAWAVLATIQFLLAIFFYLLLSRYLEAGHLYAARGLTEVVVVGMLQVAGLVMLFLTPFITMRSFSDEMRSGTLKLLLSSPVTITNLVLGKYLGIMIFYLCLMLLVALMPLSLTPGTSLDYGLFASGMFGLILLYSAFVSIGLFISTLTASAALAAVGSFVSTFLLWIAHIANDTGNPYVESVSNYLSLQKHFNSLLSGAFSTMDVSYFFLLTLMFLALSVWRLDSIRTLQ